MDNRPHLYMEFELGEIENYETIIKESYPNYNLAEFISLVLENLENVIENNPHMEYIDRP